MDNKLEILIKKAKNGGAAEQIALADYYFRNSSSDTERREKAFF